MEQPVTNDATNYENTLVQYIVMRSDLIKQHKFNVGGLIGNGSHAAIAVIQQSMNHPHTLEYLKQVNSMHTVVLSVKNDEELISTSESLNQSSILNHIWIEQPENLPVCLATRPAPRGVIQPLLKHLKLFR